MTTLLALSCLLLPTALAADTLVLTDGSEIETDGPWRVDGRRVLFTNSSGTLAALRTSNVDLDASELRTQTDKAPPTVETTSVVTRSPAREPVLVLRDGDVAPSRGFSTNITRLLGGDTPLRDEIWALHSMYQLDTEEGVQQAASSIELIANRWLEKAEKAAGKDQRELRQMALSAQKLAALASENPRSFAAQWPSPEQDEDTEAEPAG